MWGRLSNVASGVAGLVGAPAEQEDELNETRELLNHTQEELRAALRTIEQRDREIQNLSRASTTTDLSVSEEVERIREKLTSEEVRLDDIISDISFSLNEKSSTIAQLQGVIDEMRDRPAAGQSSGDPHETTASSPTCDQFYETQVSRLTELCTSLRQKEKATLSELDELRCQLTDARAQIRVLQSEKGSTGPENGTTNETIARLEEENRLLLGKVASEAAHKDILRDQLDELKENNQEKFHLLENLKELQTEIQTKTAELMKERARVKELTGECDLLQEQVTEFLAGKQKKIKDNLFEVKEAESEEEEVERLRVENTMLIARVSDLVASRDKAREEMEVLMERVENSKEGVLSELISKERELEDAMMTVSLMQEQLRERRTIGGGSGGEQIHSELVKARREIEECLRRETELREQISHLSGRKESGSGDGGIPHECPILAEWKAKCGETVTVWRQLIAQDGSRQALSSVTEEDERISLDGAHSELQELITTAELLHDRAMSCSTPPADDVTVEHLSREVDRLRDCLQARDDLIAGLREDISARQEKESSYREKVAELYSQIEQSQVEGVQDVIDFSDSFVAGLEEQLTVAQRILKIRDEEISGLNGRIAELSARPITPTSPGGPRGSFDSALESGLTQANQRVSELGRQLGEEREETGRLQATVDDQSNTIAALSADLRGKTADLARMEREYEAELLSMSSSYKDSKAASTGEMEELKGSLDRLRGRVRELERENVRVREQNERLSDDHQALVSRLQESEEDEEGEVSPLHAQFNLKQQQLENALGEIDVLRDTLHDRSEALSDLEASLSSQREVNVELQNLVDELEERVGVVSGKEEEALRHVTALEERVDEAERANEQLRDQREELERRLEELQQTTRRTAAELTSELQELRRSRDTLRDDVTTSITSVTSQCSELGSHLAVLDVIAEEGREKEVELTELRETVHKLKTQGKKVLERQKKQLKEKEAMLKKVSANCGNELVASLQQKNQDLEDKITELQESEDRLTERVAELEKAGGKLQEKLSGENPAELVSQVEVFARKFEKDTAWQHCLFSGREFDIDTAVTVMRCVPEQMTVYLDSRNSETEKEKAGLREQISIAEKAREELVQELEESRKHLADAQNTFQEERAKDTAELRRLESALLEVDASEQAATRELESERGRAETTAAEVTRLQHQKQELFVGMEELRDKIASLTEELTTSTAALSSKEEECERKAAEIAELRERCEDLEHAMDTLSSQFSLLAEERDTLAAQVSALVEEKGSLSSQVSLLSEERDGLERSISEHQLAAASPENSQQGAGSHGLKEALEAKTAECKKYLMIVKKLKLLKEEQERKVVVLEKRLSDLESAPPPQQMTFLECTDLPPEAPPMVEHAQQAAVYTVHGENSLVITETPVSLSPDRSRDPTDQSHDEPAQSADRTEVERLRAELLLYEQNVSDHAEVVAGLSEQLASSRELLSETRAQCEGRLTELIQAQEESGAALSQLTQEKERMEGELSRLQGDLVSTQEVKEHFEKELAQLKREKEEWSTKAAALDKQNLTEAETVRLMSGKPQTQEPDTTSEVSHASLVSHDTSYLSSSYTREMPSDVESLQAELIKRTKVAFFVRQKAKRMETRIREALKEAERSGAHAKVKEKISQIEKELLSISGQMKTLSSGKKMEAKTTRIDPKYVEEMEARLAYLTQVEQKYENLMEELQLQIHARNSAATEKEELETAVADLEGSLARAEEEIRDKDALLCEHLDAAAEEDARRGLLREKFDAQSSELNMLRELNKKMKQALIDVTEESARIEQTYKATLTEVEEESDQTKVENAELKEEIHQCLDRIEELEADLDRMGTLLEQQSGANNAWAQQEIERLTYENQSHAYSVEQLKSALAEVQSTLASAEEEKAGLNTRLSELNALFTETQQERDLTAEKVVKLTEQISSLERQVKEQEETMKEQAISHTDELSRLSDMAREQEAALATKEDLLTSVQAQLDEVKTSLEAAEQAKQALDMELCSSNEQVFALREELTAAGSARNSTEAEREELLTKNTELEEQVGTLGNDLKASKSKIRDLKDEISTVCCQLEEACTSQEQLRSQLTVATEERDQAAGNAEKVHNQLNDVLSKHEAAKATIVKRETEKTELQSIVDDLLAQSESMKLENVAMAQSHEEILREKQAELERLSQLLEEMKSSRDSEASDEMNVLREELSKKTTELETAVSGRLELEGKIVEFEQQNTGYLEQLHDAAYKLEQWALYSQSQEETVKGYQEQITLLSTQVEGSQHSLAEARSEREKSQSDLNQLSSEKEQLSETLESVVKSRGDLQAELEKRDAENDELSHQLKESSEAEEDLKEKLENVSGCLEEMEAARSELQETISRLTVEIQAQTENNSRLHQENQDLSAELNKGIDPQELEEIRGQLSKKDQELIQSMENAGKLQSRLEQIETQVSGMESLREAVSEKEKKLTALEQQLEDAYSGNEEALSVMRSELSALKQEKEELETLNSRLTESNSTLEEGLAKLHDSVQESGAKITHYEGMLANWQVYEEQQRGYIESLTEQISTNQVAFNDLQSAFTELQAQRETLESDTKSKEEAIKALEQRIAEFETTLAADVASLKEQVTAKEGKIAELNQQLANLSETNSQLQSAVEEKDALGAELTSKKSELAKLAEEKETVMKKAKGIMKAYKDAKMELEKLKKDSAEQATSVGDVEQLRSQVNELTLAKESLEVTKATMEQENSVLLGEVEQFEVERQVMAGIKDENARLNSALMEQSSRLESLQCEYDAVSGDIRANVTQLAEEKQAVEGQVEQLRLKIGETELALSGKADEVARLQECLAEKERAISAAEEEKTALQGQCIQASEKLYAAYIANQQESASLVIANHEREQLTNQVSGLKTQLSTCQAEIEALKQQSGALISEKEQLGIQESELMTELSNRRAEIEVLKRDSEVLLSEKQQLGSQVSDLVSQLSNRQAEMEVLKRDSELVLSEKQKLGSQISDLTSQLSDCRAEIEALKREVDLLNGDRSSLEDEVRLKSEKVTSVLELCDTHEKRLLSKEQELVVLQQSLTDMSSQLRETTALLSTAQEAQSQESNTTVQLQAEIQALKSQVEAVQWAGQEKDGRIGHLQNQIATLESRLEAANSPERDEELLNAIRQREAHIEELRVQSDSLQAELSQSATAFEGEKSEMKNELKIIQNELESLKTQLTESQTSVEHLSASLESSRANESDLSSKLKTSEETASGLRSQLQTELEQRVALNEQMEQRVVLNDQIEQLAREKSDLQTRMEILSARVQELTTFKEEAELTIAQSKTEQETLQMAINDQTASKELNSKISSLEEANEALKTTLTTAQESLVELTAKLDQKTSEVAACERNILVKKKQIEDLTKKLSDSEREIEEKTTQIAQLKIDFETLVSSNALLDDKLKTFTSTTAAERSAAETRLQEALDGALAESATLRENNDLLVKNNHQLTENYTTLHSSVAVFQERDNRLNEMVTRLSAHNTSLEQHISETREQFLEQLQQANREKDRLAGLVRNTGAVAELNEEVGLLKESKRKLAAQVETYQGRLTTATGRADALEKKLSETTSLFNEQCSLLEKRNGEVAKVTGHYKALKQRLISELNTRKSMVQETMNGRDKMVAKFGEKAKKIKELNSQLAVCQRDREMVTTAVQGILECLTPLKGSEEIPDNQRSDVVVSLEHRAHDVISFLSRPILPLNDTADNLSEYAPSDWDTSNWENRSETSLLSDITGFSAVNSTLQTPLMTSGGGGGHYHPRSGSVASSVVSERAGGRFNNGVRTERSPAPS